MPCPPGPDCQRADIGPAFKQWLVEFVGKARQEVFNLRFQHATGQLEDTAAMKRAKRDLARALIALGRGLNFDIIARTVLVGEGKACQCLIAPGTFVNGPPMAVPRFSV